MKTIMMISLFVLFYACNPVTPKKQKETSTKNVTIEKFENVNISDLNTKLSQITKNLTPKDIMKVFYPYEVESGEGNEKITISEKTLNDDVVVVELIHDNLLDDSVKGEKYLMELKKQENSWKVVSLKKNWKCWRGNADWGTESCI